MDHSVVLRVAGATVRAIYKSCGKACGTCPNHGPYFYAAHANCAASQYLGLATKQRREHLERIGELINEGTPLCDQCAPTWLHMDPVDGGICEACNQIVGIKLVYRPPMRPPLELTSAEHRRAFDARQGALAFTTSAATGRQLLPQGADGDDDADTDTDTDQALPSPLPVASGMR